MFSGFADRYLDVFDTPRLGCWYDATPSQTFKDWDATAKKMRSSRLEDYAVEVNRQTDKDWGFTKWKAGDLIRFGDLLEEEDLGKLTLMVWPRPTRDFIDQMLLTLPEIAKKCGAVAIEFDVEGGNWQEKYLEGFDDIEDAGRYLVESFRKATDCLLGASFHTGRINRSVSELVDYVAPQAYSTYDEGDEYDGRYEVVNMQIRAWKKVMEIEDEDGKRFIIVGLAAYRQKYPGHSPLDAMFAAADAAIELGAAHLRWWSWKHIMGHRDNGYAEEAIACVYDRFRE